MVQKLSYCFPEYIMFSKWYPPSPFVNWRYATTFLADPLCATYTHLSRLAPDASSSSPLYSMSPYKV